MSGEVFPSRRRTALQAPGVGGEVRVRSAGSSAAHGGGIRGPAVDGGDRPVGMLAVSTVPASPSVPRASSVL